MEIFKTRLLVAVVLASACLQALVAQRMTDDWSNSDHYGSAQGGPTTILEVTFEGKGGFKIVDRWIPVVDGQDRGGEQLETRYRAGPGIDVAQRWVRMDHPQATLPAGTSGAPLYSYPVENEWKAEHVHADYLARFPRA